MSMRRKQLYIDDELDQALRNLASATGRSEADHVREALRAYLPLLARRKSKDALAELVGLIGDDQGPSDLAKELDHYAYGVPKGHKRRR